MTTSALDIPRRTAVVLHRPDDLTVAPRRSDGRPDAGQRIGGPRVGGPPLASPYVGAPSVTSPYVGGPSVTSPPVVGPRDGGRGGRRQAPSTELRPQLRTTGPRSGRRQARREQQQQRRRRVGRASLDALACILVFLALLAPNQLGRLSPGAFVRIPVEALIGIALVLALPVKALRPVAVGGGVTLGVLTIGKFLDMGFFSTLTRPFDPTLDLELLGNAVEFVSASYGGTAAIAAAVGTVVLAVAVVALLTLSVVRITRLAARHNTVATSGTAVLTVVWVVCAALGIQTAPGQPMAAKDTINASLDRGRQVWQAQQDKEAFAAESFADAARTTPDDQLLTKLKGKDVIVAFVESYGRDAVEDPELGAGVGKVLTDGTTRLQAKGFSSRSAWLTSPTAGGGSWLAQSTFLSGVWTNNQKRYRNLVESDRETLNSSFRRAGWRTVGVVPGVTRAWPEGQFFRFNQVYDSRQLGYKGPIFSWSKVPDQYTLAAFDRLEYSKKNRGPIMAEIPLTSSHIPWAPLPKMIGWDEVGNGSVYKPIAAAGEKPDGLVKNPGRARDAYRRGVEYSLSALLSYVENYGNDNLVVIFLGDHQPSPLITGQGASRDVPIAILAHDPAVMQQISSWGWQEGLKPSPKSPVWRMDTFRDKFLTAYGSTAS